MAGPYLIDDALYQDPEAGLYGALRRLGVNPNSSYYGSAIKRRAATLQPLLNMSTFDAKEPGQARGFIDQYASSLLSPGGGGPYAPGAIGSLLRRFTDAQENDPAYQVLHTGDPKQDYTQWQDVRAIENANASPILRAAQKQLDAQKFMDMQAEYVNGTLPNNMTWLDYILGRQAQAVKGAQEANIPAPTAGGAAPAGTGTGQPGGGSSPAAPAGPTPGQAPTGGVPKSWQDLINLLKGNNGQNAGLDQVRMGQGSRGSQKVTIGNVTYDPSQDQEFWWWGKDKSLGHRQERGESNWSRLTRWLSENQAGSAHGGVTGDPMAQLAGLVRMLNEEAAKKGRTQGTGWSVQG